MLAHSSRDPQSMTKLHCCCGSVAWQNVTIAKMYGRSSIVHLRKERGMHTGRKKGRDSISISRGRKETHDSDQTCSLTLDQNANGEHGTEMEPMLSHFSALVRRESVS